MIEVIIQERMSAEAQAIQKILRQRKMLLEEAEKQRWRIFILPDIRGWKVCRRGTRSTVIFFTLKDAIRAAKAYRMMLSS